MKLKKVHEPFKKLQKEAEERDITIEELLHERGHETWEDFVRTCEGFTLSTGTEEYGLISLTGLLN